MNAAFNVTLNGELKIGTALGDRFGEGAVAAIQGRTRSHVELPCLARSHHSAHVDKSSTIHKGTVLAMIEVLA